MVLQVIALFFLVFAIVLGFVKNINVGIVSMGLALVLGLIGGVETVCDSAWNDVFLLSAAGE